jgi:putative transposase
MWNLPPPPGFQGLRDDLPLTMYSRHLPHWRQPGATYFATFRLADSLPQSKLSELAAWRDEWERRNPEVRTEGMWLEFACEAMRRVEVWLDQGMGSCVLRDPSNAATIVQAFQKFDEQRYELASYVIMPNHVHLIVRPYDNDEQSLETILKSWKQFTAREINRRMGQHGAVWQQESFDRIVRDEEHLYRCIQYIGSNPARANLPLNACLRWIHPEWRTLGWDFE